MHSMSNFLDTVHTEISYLINLSYKKNLSDEKLQLKIIIQTTVDVIRIYVLAKIIRTRNYRLVSELSQPRYTNALMARISKINCPASQKCMNMICK